jgi:hypothetical protein
MAILSGKCPICHANLEWEDEDLPTDIKCDDCHYNLKIEYYMEFNIYYEGIKETIKG